MLFNFIKNPKKIVVLLPALFIAIFFFIPITVQADCFGTLKYSYRNNCGTLADTEDVQECIDRGFCEPEELTADLTICDLVRRCIDERVCADGDDEGGRSDAHADCRTLY